MFRMKENANFRKFNLNAKKLNFERGKKPCPTSELNLII